MLALFEFTFMQHALMAAWIVSLICGILGTLIVVNRMVFIAGGIAHGSYGGIGLAVYFGIAPMLGASLFALFLGLVIALIAQRHTERLDALIGAMWAFGMAFGIILSDITPGYNVDLMGYLFGALLSVSTEDLWAMGAVFIMVLGGVGLFYKQLLAMSFDPQFAKLRGVNVGLLYTLLLAFIALGVVIVIRAVGLILVIALLSIPPYMAEKWTHSMVNMMLVSSVLSFLFCLLGLLLSSYADLSSGACIILVASVSFFAQLLWLHFHEV